MTKKNFELTIDDVIGAASTYITAPEEIESIKEAYKYAEKKHFGQVRMTGEEYIEHPLNVAYILTEINADYQYYLSLFLNSNWQKFWQLRKQVQDDLGFNLEVWNDGSLTVELDTIAKWLVEWSKFEKQNNNPLLTKEINRRIDVYTYAFMMPNVYDYTNWQDVESDYEYSDYKQPRKITLIGRAKYEKLLKNIPYNSKANEILSKGYYILKHNNYTSNEAYYALFPEDEEQQENE